MTRPSPRQRRRQRQAQRQLLNAPTLRTPRTPAPEPVQQALPIRLPVCDRSADVGTTHYWREGAQPGEFCLCGKRKKYAIDQPL